MPRSAAVATTLLLAAAAAKAAPLPPPALAEAQLRALNHAYVSAYAKADPAFMEKLAGPDLRITDSRGNWHDRAGHLAEMRESSLAGGASCDQVEVRLFGEIALVNGIFLQGGEPLAKVRYTDVYHWDGEAWRLVGAQNTPLREGVAEKAATGEKPAIAPWTGKDPEGDDEAVLRQLNEAYVDAFRRADVSWYDAHLAADYTVVSSDGSRQDRGRALQDFAKPTFAEHLETFPVGAVSIRRFGDVALIHAENDFQLKDGRRGINRYTDVWQKQKDGRWRCLAANITTFKKPG